MWAAENVSMCRVVVGHSWTILLQAQLLTTRSPEENGKLGVIQFYFFATTTTTTTVLRPFVRDYPVKPVPEETLPTHHPDHLPIFISFFHLPRSIASSLSNCVLGNLFASCSILTITRCSADTQVSSNPILGVCAGPEKSWNSSFDFSGPPPLGAVSAEVSACLVLLCTWMCRRGRWNDVCCLPGRISSSSASTWDKAPCRRLITLLLPTPPVSRSTTSSRLRTGWRTCTTTGRARWECLHRARYVHMMLMILKWSW